MSDPLPSDRFFLELAFLYLLMAFGTDGQLDEAEVETVADRLRARYPDLSPADARAAVADALAAYVKTEQPRTRARQSTTLLKERLPLPGRWLLYDDLCHVAEADGTVTEGERLLLEHLADVWEIEDTDD